MESKYNIKLNSADKMIVFNSLSKSMISVSNEYIDEFSKKIALEDESDELYRKLQNSGFVIDNENSNESECVEEEYKSLCLGKSRLNIIILPTYKCNFRCTYCYETFQDVSMTKQTAEDVYSFVENIIYKYSSLEVSWFGGEPMLEMDTIVFLSEKFKRLCQNQRKVYIANITTNGYLLTIENFKKLLKCNVRTFQITIDGLKETHNSFRHLENGGETYDTIINNLQMISQKVKTGLFQIVIRTNITRDLEDSIDSHIKCMNGYFGRDPRFRHVSRIAFSYKNNDVKPKLYNTDDFINSAFSKLPDKIINENNRFHFMDSFRDFLNGQASVCYAGKESSLVIDPNGVLMKCTVCLDDDINIIGDVRNGINETKIKKWLLREKDIDTSKACDSCKIYPICFGVSCPYDRFALEHNNEKCANRIKDVLLYVKILSEDTSVCENIDRFFVNNNRGDVRKGGKGYET